MLSTGEWIRNRRLQGLRTEIAARDESKPVFTTQIAQIQGKLNVGSVRSIRQTGTSKIRNLASVYTDLVGLRAGDEMSKRQLNFISANPSETKTSLPPSLFVTPLFSCTTCNATLLVKSGLCPVCRK